MRYDLSENDLKRFSEKVLKSEDSNECWKWIGTKDYGIKRKVPVIQTGEYVKKQYIKAECENSLSSLEPAGEWFNIS